MRSLTTRRCIDPLVTVLGITFKEDVPDIRNSKVIDILRELDRFGMRTQVQDPLAIDAETRHEYGVSLTLADKLAPADAVILAVAHRDYVYEGWALMQRLLRGGKGVVLDIKSRLDRASKPENIELWQL